MTNRTLTFKDCFDNLYVLQPYKGFYRFSIGHVESWKELKPTYESEYNNLGLVDMSAYINHIKPVLTNNPDYVLRLSLGYLFV